MVFTRTLPICFSARVATVALAGALCQATVQGSPALGFEAEAVSTPETAWVRDRDTPDHWNLWSKDTDADKKWSGGIVLRSPLVKTERATPEEGAPPLHTRITGLPNGKYDVELRVGRTVGVSLDGESWRPYMRGPLVEGATVSNGVFECWVDDRYVHSANPGAGYYDYITLTPCPVIVPKPRVELGATVRVEERLDRGVVALPVENGVYVGWRLLRGDAPDTGFLVYRQAAGEATPTRLTATPLTTVCEFVDRETPHGVTLTYSIHAAANGTEDVRLGEAGVTLTDDNRGRNHISLPLAGRYGCQKCAIADLDGDGRYDYVIKQPNSSIDPWVKYWKPSSEPYTLEAYAHDGKRLWKQCLGWAIETGIWYSPYLVYDFDGDGRAEVAAKAGEGDPRDPDGRVRGGPEWLVVWDGLTGRERARVPWPDRTGFEADGEVAYNHASRNQLAVAYLDGKTPCLLALRGTYSTMKADAYALRGHTLQPLWRYTDAEGGRRYRGQGAHYTHCADIDGDGRDEVILGSAVIDDNGSPLWSTGLGHPDHVFVGDLDPVRPGLEIYYGIETRQPANGMCMVDAKTGKLLWGYKGPTHHIHSCGLCADIDARWPGNECYGADSADHKPTGDRWLWSAQGKLIATNVDFGFGIPVVYWDGDPQRELIVKSRIKDYGADDTLDKIEGSIVMIADILGDWREEIVTSLPGELRIYSTTHPAADRRVCLMQDAFYRADIAMGSMGYRGQPPR